MATAYPILLVTSSVEVQMFMVQRPKAYLWCGPAAPPQPNLQKKLSICEKQLRESAESSKVKKQINKQKKVKFETELRLLRWGLLPAQVGRKKNTNKEK